MTDENPGRVPVRYVSDEPGEIALPGYLNALPSIVSPGDVFTIEADLVEELTSSARFELVDGDDVAPASPNETLTKAQLGEKLGLDEATVKDTLHADLVALADQYDRENPPLPNGGGNPDDVVPASPNEEGQDS